MLPTDTEVERFVDLQALPQMNETRCREGNCKENGRPFVRSVEVQTSRYYENRSHQQSCFQKTVATSLREIVSTHPVDR